MSFDEKAKSVGENKKQEDNGLTGRPGCGSGFCLKKNHQNFPMIFNRVELYDTDLLIQPFFDQPGIIGHDGKHHQKNNDPGIDKSVRIMIGRNMEEP